MKKTTKNEPTKLPAVDVNGYGKTVQQIKSICTLQIQMLFYFAVSKTAISLATIYIQAAEMSFPLFHLFLVEVP